jgi:hypothetical protein
VSDERDRRMVVVKITKNSTDKGGNKEEITSNIQFF